MSLHNSKGTTSDCTDDESHSYDDPLNYVKDDKKMNQLLLRRAEGER